MNRRNFIFDFILLILAFFFGYSVKKEGEDRNLFKKDSTIVVDNLGNNISTKLTENEEIISELSEIIINAKTLGIKGDGTDEKTKIETAINSLPDGSTVWFPFTKTGYAFTSLNLKPKYITFISDGKTIFKSLSIGSSMIVANTGFNIKGIVLDGERKAKIGLYIAPGVSNINIRDCVIKNLVGDGTNGAYGVWLKGDNNNIEIRRNLFKDIMGLENGINGDSPGAARGVYTYPTPEGLRIEENTFDNIGGFEDGDAIHIQSRTDTEFQYSIAKNVVIKNNTFLNVKKRAIKLQASGIEVDNNYIESNFYSTITKCNTAGISIFGSRCVIKENRIFLKRSVCGIELHNGYRNIIKDNTIEVDKAKAYSTTGARTNTNIAGILLLNTNGTLIKGNEIMGKMGIYSSAANSNIKVNGNYFKKDCAFPIYLIGSSNILSIGENHFLGIDGKNPYQAITLYNLTNTIINNNLLEVGGIGIRLHGALNKVDIFGNNLRNMVINRISITDVTTGIETLNIGEGQFNKVTFGTRANAPKSTSGYTNGDEYLYTDPIAGGYRGRILTIGVWKEFGIIQE